MPSLPVLDIQPFLTDPAGRQAAEFVEQLRHTLHGHPDLVRRFG